MLVWSFLCLLASLLLLFICILAAHTPQARNSDHLGTFRYLPRMMISIAFDLVFPGSMSFSVLCLGPYPTLVTVLPEEMGAVD